MAMKNFPVSEPKKFAHELFGKIRYFKDGDELWFVAADVAKALDIKNVSKSLLNFPEDERMTLTTGYSHSGKRGGAQFLTLVSEPGFYRLIFMSRKPEAEKFKRWVFHEVLPSIRKNGYYIAPQEKIIKIEGRENYNDFRANHPDLEVKQIMVAYDYLDEDKIEYTTHLNFYVTLP